MGVRTIKGRRLARIWSLIVSKIKTWNFPSFPTTGLFFIILTNCDEKTIRDCLSFPILFHSGWTIKDENQTKTCSEMSNNINTKNADETTNLYNPKGRACGIDL